MSGEESRRRVHELRAGADAVAVGMGTFRADDRGSMRAVSGPDASRAGSCFGRGPLPEGSELELVEEPLDEALSRLGGEGVQSLLLEGGPTLATAFFADDLVDKLLLFVAPTVAGAGERWLGSLSEPRPLTRLTAEPSGDDLLLTAYVHEP